MSELYEEWKKLYSHLNEAQLGAQFTDVVIRVKDRSFKCHRVILSAVETFERMFTGNFVEAGKEEIELKGHVDPDDFEIFLSFIYCRIHKINDENVLHLLKSSHYLGPDTLEKKCVNYITERNLNFNINCAVKTFLFVCKMEILPLMETLENFMAVKFETVTKYPEFIQVPGKQLRRILSTSNNRTDSKNILEFVARWMKINRLEAAELRGIYSSRDVSLDAAVEVYAANLGLFDTDNDDGGDPSHTMQQLENYQINESTSVGSLETEINTFKDELPNSLMRIDLENSECFRENKLPFSLYMRENLDILPRTHCECVNRYELFKRNKSSYVRYANMDDCHSDLLYFKYVFVDGVPIKLICSIDDEKNVDPASRTYDFKFYYLRYPDAPLRKVGRSHKLTKPINTHLENVALTAHGTEIYVHNDDEFLMYNIFRNEWFNIRTDERRRLISPNLISNGNELYLIGGKYSEFAYNDNVQDHSEMSTVPPNNYRRRHDFRKRARTNVQVSVEDSIKDGKFFQRLDLREGKWSPLPEMNYAHYKAASCVYKDILYVTGGDNLAYYKGYIEYFDFRAGKWHTFETSMPQSKMKHILIPYDNQLWFFGGKKCDVFAHRNLKNDLSWNWYDLEQRTWSNVYSIEEEGGKYTTTEILDVQVKN